MAVLSTSFKLPQGVIGGLTGANQLLFDIRTGPTDRPSLREILITSAGCSVSNMSPIFAFGRNGSVGVVRPNAIVLTSEDDVNLPVGGISIGTAWDTIPTAPTNYFRRFTGRNLGAAAASHNFLMPLHGLTIEPSSSFGLWCTPVNASNTFPLNWTAQVSMEI